MQTGRFMLEENNFKLKLEYTRLDFSSHTGREDLFKFVEKVNPKKVFCVHGDNTPEFAKDLNEKGFDAVAPTEDNRMFKV